MFIRIFNTNHPLVFLYLFIYALILKGSFFLLPFELTYNTVGFLNNPVFDGLTQLPYWRILVHSLSIFLVFVQAVMFNQILILNRITQLQTFVPAAIFITLSSLQPEFIILNPVNIAYILILPVFHNLFQLPDKENAVESLFYSGLLIALASLFYFPATYLLIFLVFGVIWLKNPSGREFFMPFVAYLIPYVLMGVYYFVTEQWDFYRQFLMALLPDTIGVTIDNPGAWLFAGVMFLLVLAGYFRSLQTPQQDVIQYGKYLTVLLSAIIIGLGSLFFVEGDQLIFSYLFMAPVSIFIGSLFDVEKPNFFLRLLFWGLILLSGFFQWQYYTQVSGQPGLF